MDCDSWKVASEFVRHWPRLCGQAVKSVLGNRKEVVKAMTPDWDKIKAAQAKGTRQHTVALSRDHRRRCAATAQFMPTRVADIALLWAEAAWNAANLDTRAKMLRAAFRTRRLAKEDKKLLRLHFRKLHSTRRAQVGMVFVIGGVAQLKRRLNENDAHLFMSALLTTMINATRYGAKPGAKRILN